MTNLQINHFLFNPKELLRILLRERRQITILAVQMLQNIEFRLLLRILKQHTFEQLEQRIVRLITHCTLLLLVLNPAWLHDSPEVHIRQVISLQYLLHVEIEVWPTTLLNLSDSEQEVWQSLRIDLVDLLWGLWEVSDGSVWVVFYELLCLIGYYLAMDAPLAQIPPIVKNYVDDAVLCELICVLVEQFIRHRKEMWVLNS